MNGRRIVGAILVVAGVLVLFFGGVFWRDRDTVFKAGPVEVQTEEQKGVGLPPLAGAALVIGGLVLMALPARR